MQVRAFLGQAHLYLHQSWDKARAVKQISKDWIVNTFAEIHAYWKNEIWEHHVKSYYECYIEPIRKGDLVVASSCAAVAIAIAFLAPAIFGKPFFAIAAIASFTLLLGTCSFTLHRVRKSHDAKAWEFVDQIRRAVNLTTRPSHHFAAMRAALSEFQKPQFAHLENDIRTLEEQIRAFKNSATALRVEGNAFEDAKQALLNHLEGLQGKLAHHRPIEDLPHFASNATTHDSEEPASIPSSPPEETLPMPDSEEPPVEVPATEEPVLTEPSTEVPSSPSEVPLDEVSPPEEKMEVIIEENPEENP